MLLLLLLSLFCFRWTASPAAGVPCHGARLPALPAPGAVWFIVPTVLVVRCEFCLMLLLSPRSATLAVMPQADAPLLTTSTLRAFCRSGSKMQVA